MIFRIVALTFFVISCSHQHHGENASNQHMHQKSYRELISSFDDPRRDNWQKPEMVLGLIGPLAGKRVIDIGAGSGYFSKYFLNSGAEVVAADVDDKFLEHLKKSFPPEKFPDVTFKKIFFDDPKMGKDSYDYAFTSNTYHHIDHRDEYLKKVYEGLKVGGEFVVLDFKPGVKSSFRPGPPDKMRVPITTVIKEMLEAGFDHLRIYDRNLEHQYLVIGKKL
jgi:ubiquinone/menaquinone biosynthesis C-methylase UbiE